MRTTTNGFYDRQMENAHTKTVSDHNEESESYNDYCDQKQREQRNEEDEQ
jgi:hypothetical protein